MKRLIVAVIIFLSLIILCSLALFGTEKAAANMISKTEELQTLAEKNDPQMAKALENVENEWDKFEPILSMYTPHGEIEGIAATVAILREYYEFENYEQLRGACRQIITASEHLKISEEIRLRNIL